MASSQSHPSDPPPSYSAATASDPDPTIKPLRRVPTSGPTSRTTRNGIPPSHRRSMEDENRELPPGWIRQFDPVEQHQFFVDTKASPPRSIWTHPYDDPTFLSTLSEEERSERGRLARSVTLEDVTAESSDEEDEDSKSKGRAHAGKGERGNEDQPRGFHRFTRKMKDTLTDSTHQQRQEQRVQRAEAEHRAYAAHVRAREAMVRAMQTGEPQFLGKDAQGRDVYIEAPGGPSRAHGMGAGGVGGLGLGGTGGAGGMGMGMGGPGVRYTPYAHPMYADPNVRFVRPSGPYGRPYGYGYGGGMGAPVAAGILGGVLLGGALF